MMYITVPTKARLLEGLFNIKDYNQTSSLLSRHGYKVSEFGKNVVAFYKAAELKKENNSVPMHSFYKMEKKDFSVFVEAIQKLDDMEKKMNNYIKFVNSSLV